MDAIGTTTWVVAAARVPVEQHQQAGRLPRRPDHHGRDRACVLNTGTQDAQVTITLFFAERAPIGPYPTVVAAQTMHYVNFATLAGSAPIPTGVDFCAVFTSNRPIVVQHVQRDVHDDNVTTVSSMAYGG